jgi:hypothetical protein
MYVEALPWPMEASTATFSAPSFTMCALARTLRKRMRGLDVLDLALVVHEKQRELIEQASKAAWSSWTTCASGASNTSEASSRSKSSVA